LLILKLRAATLLFEYALTLHGPTLPAIPLLPILVRALVLIRTPIALSIV
jgi:hypothetical protein